MSFHVHPYQQDKWDFSPVIPKITSPCKHRGVYPVAGSLVGEGKDAGWRVRISAETPLSKRRLRILPVRIHDDRVERPQSRSRFLKSVLIKTRNP